MPSQEIRSCYVMITFLLNNRNRIVRTGPFLGFLDPPPPLRQHVFSTKNKQKLAFSDPPTSPNVIYEWSLRIYLVFSEKAPIFEKKKLILF